MVNYQTVYLCIFLSSQLYIYLSFSSLSDHHLAFLICVHSPFLFFKFCLLLVHWLRSHFFCFPSIFRFIHLGALSSCSIFRPFSSIFWIIHHFSLMITQITLYSLSGVASSICYQRLPSWTWRLWYVNILSRFFYCLPCAPVYLQLILCRSYTVFIK